MGTVIAAGVACFLLVPACVVLAHRIGAVDRPDARRIHGKPVANWGGVAVGVSTAWWIPLGALLICAVGAVDGIKPLPARIKIVAQVTAASLAVPEQDFLNWMLSLGWIILMTNAMNLIDGADGLATGTALLTFSTVALLLPTPPIWLWPLIAALVAFWAWNWHPATVFLGDSGSYLLGFCLGVATLSLPWAVRLTLCAYPIADVALAFWRRGWHWAQPDKLHLHHRLLTYYAHPAAVSRLYVGVLVTTWLALSI